jgi:phenylalanyl-tRNA synthetase beta chain
MKISYKHIVKKISSNPSIEELSEKLFQLGHEHEIYNDIFDFEFTPNRGDCLSTKGILRDLKLFYKLNENSEIYKENINPLKLQFINNAVHDCQKISFLKIEIEAIPSKYEVSLENYFSDLDIKRNNFFTDISNYISYETGQPTHCYDADAMTSSIKLDYNSKKARFNTLLDQNIEINKNELVFLNEDDEIINLAGIIGGKLTACSTGTKSVIVECAHFNPEVILGKSVKYDIKSEAAHKFERNTDLLCHEYVLRRFLKVVENHTRIKKVEIFTESFLDTKPRTIPLNIEKINNILGTSIDKNQTIKFLSRLGFDENDNYLTIPSFRNDIYNDNDIAEEIARAIGYNNIKNKSINILIHNQENHCKKELLIKNLLIENGFYEVINNPFTSESSTGTIKVDNPLDSKKNFIRTNLKQSLINNLLYNERRQQDSIKLFEISNVYTKNNFENKRVIGIIASGRVGKNYKDFSKKIDNEYLLSVFKNNISNIDLNFQEIQRAELETKIKNHISYLELNINSMHIIEDELKEKKNIQNFKKYSPISGFPSSTRDLSFSIKNPMMVEVLEDLILDQENPLLKEIFVFDYFKNIKSEEVKIGFRLVFQSLNTTITDDEVEIILSDIIKKSLLVESVSIPGLKNI